MNITLVLHNIRSTYNVGAILRTAEGFGVEKVVLSGYTPWHKKPGLLPHLAEKLEHQITKTAVGADKMVETEWVDDLPAWLDLQSAGDIFPDVPSTASSRTTLIGLENNLDDPRLQTLDGFITNRETARQRLADHGIARPEEKAILVLGEEVNGIPPEILGKLDVLLEIPMKGQKESFNVSVAAGVALYELTKY